MMQEINSSQSGVPAETDSAPVHTSKGTVKNFDMSRKYGFITHDDGTQIFVHQEALAEGVIIARGDRVSFQSTDGPKGPRAVHVRKI